MKKTWTFILSVCLAVCALCSGFALTACDSGRKKLDLTISNYAEYDGLMAGVPNEAYVSPAAKAVFRAEAYKDEKQKMPKLYGRRKDGSYEQIEFEEENDITTKYGLCNMSRTGDFIFLTYSKNYVGEAYGRLGFDLWQSDRYDLILDIKTGKLFDVTQYHIGFFDCYDEVSYSARSRVVGDALYFSAYMIPENSKHPGIDLSAQEFGIYSMRIVEGQLEIERKIDTDSETGLWEFQDLGIDRYGNFYSRDFTTQDSEHCCYLYTRSGDLIRLKDTTVHIAANGIAYCASGAEIYNYNQQINEEAEIEVASFVPDGMDNDSYDYLISRLRDGSGYINNSNLYREAYWSSRIFVYQEANVFYCTSSGSDFIKKYEFADDVKYSVEYIECEKSIGKENDLTEKVVFAEEKIYLLNNEEIYYIDIRDGSAHTLSSGYIFKKIYSDNQGGIIFEGLDERLNTVTGMIGADDTVTVGITPREYEIFYIASLN